MNAIESSTLGNTNNYSDVAASSAGFTTSPQSDNQNPTLINGVPVNPLITGNNIQIVNHFAAPNRIAPYPMGTILQGYQNGGNSLGSGFRCPDSMGYISGMLNTLTQMVNTLTVALRGLFDRISAPIQQGVGAAAAVSGGYNTVGGTNSYPAPGTNALSQPIVRSALDVNTSDSGIISVRTLDGYTIRAEGKDQAWSITGPDGKSTRIWGDPHVSESDGDKWDFMNRSTFMFGLNKATIEVVPAANGQTYSARLTIYGDRERVTIDGIDKDKPQVTAASDDGIQHDAALADGEIYTRVITNTGESWVSEMTGKVVSVTR